jgi:membrane protease YdiL (CAAX protease family)
LLARHSARADKFTTQKLELLIMMYLKTRPAWAQLLMFIGLAFGSFLILSMIGMLILSKITGLNILEMSDPAKWDYKNPALLTFVRGMLLIQFVSLFILPCFLFAYFSDPKPTEYLGLRSAKPFYFLLGAVLLILALPLVDWLGVFNHQLIPETTPLGKWMKESEEAAAQQIAFMLKRNTVQDLFMNLLFIAVFAGVGEEFFFRGVLQRIFIRLFKNVWAGIIITAIIFSAIHFQFYGFIPRFILGVLLGLIYWYSGSLWPAIIAHTIYDGFAVVMIYFNPGLADQEGATLQIGNQLVLALISAVLVGAVIYQMKKKSTNSYEIVYAGDKVEESNPFS